MDFQGIASLALLPSGSISGHFIHPLTSTCFGLFGTQIICERECSRGEDYRLVKLTIIDYASKKEKQVVVECRGHDATRFQNATDIHGWEEDVMQILESNKKRMDATFVTFECEVLKADRDAEEHINQYLPSLSGWDAVVNIGPMTIRGLNFDASEDAQTCEDTLSIQSQEDVPDADGCHCEHSGGHSSQIIETYDVSAITSEGDENSLDNAHTGQTFCCLDDKEPVLEHECLETEVFTRSVPMNRWQEDPTGWRKRN